ncbi:MAG: MFS transporter [Myxococcales bacterium]|nr:MFS transporter [Myxococcales bacterium]
MSDAEAATPARGRRNLVALSAASFFTDVASEMVTHLLPLVLAGVMGASATAIGAIEGVAGALTSLVKAAVGQLSDRWNRRQPLVLLGYGLSALARPFFALAGSAAGLAGVRWTDRLGKGIRTAPRDALLADGTPAASRGRAFGLHRAADTAGAVVGVAVAVWILTRHGGVVSAESFRSVVLLATIPGFLAVAVIALWVRELPRRSQPATAASRGSLGRPFWWFLATCALFDLADPSEAFLVLRASDLGASATWALTLMALANVVYAGVATPAGALSDRIGRRPILLLGWTLHAAVCLGLAFVPVAWLPLVLAGHGAVVWALAFSPDGRWLLSGGQDGVALLQPADGRGAPTRLDHDWRVHDVDYAADGMSIVTASGDQRARVWRLDAPGRPRATPRALQHDAEVASARLLDDGRVITTTYDDALWIWPSRGDASPRVIRGPALASTRVSADGRLAVTRHGQHGARAWALEPVALHASLWRSPGLCVAPQEREALLAETPAQARRSFAACEARERP